LATRTKKSRGTVVSTEGGDNVDVHYEEGRFSAFAGWGPNRPSSVRRAPAEKEEKNGNARRQTKSSGGPTTPS